MAGPLPGLAALAIVLALALVACGSDGERVAAACLEGPGPISTALARAPARVTLDDGTRLSDCVGRMRTDAELQSIGGSLLSVAYGLRSRARTDGGPALRLGYLAGAVRRGAAHSPGLATQLLRRVQQAAQLRDARRAARAALEQGLRAGESGG